MKANFLNRLQKLSLAKRKLIFWSIMIFLGFIFLIIFIFLTADRLRNFSGDKLKKDFNFPSLELSPTHSIDNIEGQQKN